MSVSLDPRDVVVSLDEGSELRLVCESPWREELELDYEGPSIASVWISPAAVVRWFIDGEERTTADFNAHTSRAGLASAAVGDSLPTYVRDLSTHKGLIEVSLSDDVDAPALRQIGGRPSSIGFWIFRVENRSRWTFPGGDDAMAPVLTALRDLGLALVGAGPGWHPGGIFELLREKGLVTGSYRKIEWHAPGDWVVREG